MPQNAMSSATVREGASSTMSAHNMLPRKHDARLVDARVPSRLGGPQPAAAKRDQSVWSYFTGRGQDFVYCGSQPWCVQTRHRTALSDEEKQGAQHAAAAFAPADATHFGGPHALAVFCSAASSPASSTANSDADD